MPQLQEHSGSGAQEHKSARVSGRNSELTGSTLGTQVEEYLKFSRSMQDKVLEQWEISWSAHDTLALEQAEVHWNTKKSEEHWEHKGTKI